MGYHPRIETTDISGFQTTRCKNSELWFVDNPELENVILGFLAKFQARYQTKLYAFAIPGNHIHVLAKFPQANRSHFMRDLNSCIARAVPRYVSCYSGGKLWGRRYSNEFVPDMDIEEQFFYTVLQAVNDGHVSKISNYRGYNCFHDAVHGITRKFKVVNWSAYNERRRWNENVSITNFIEIVTLRYDRLPGYEEMSQQEYAKLMYEKLEFRRREILNRRRSLGFIIPDDEDCPRRVKPGSRPLNSKVSDCNSSRPRVLSRCPIRSDKFKDWYFNIYFLFKLASRLYRSGVLDAQFPPGTFRPPSFTIGFTGSNSDLL